MKSMLPSATNIFDRQHANVLQAAPPPWRGHPGQTVGMPGTVDVQNAAGARLRRRRRHAPVPTASQYYGDFLLQEFPVLDAGTPKLLNASRRLSGGPPAVLPSYPDDWS
jgi:hypothetical protein